jgi:hypothetical protein
MTEGANGPGVDAGRANWGKIMEALVLMRSACGSEMNLDIESQSLKGMIAYINTVGCPYQYSRVLMTLIELYRENPTPELRRLIQYQESRLYNRGR